MKHTTPCLYAAEKYLINHSTKPEPQSPLLSGGQKAADERGFVLTDSSGECSRDKTES
jgi:hypothetical protein